MRFTALFVALLTFIAVITWLNLQHFESVTRTHSTLVSKHRRTLQDDQAVMSPPAELEYAGDSVVAWGNDRLKVGC